MPEITRATPVANNTESKPFSRYSFTKYIVNKTIDTIQAFLKYFIIKNTKKNMPRPKGSPNKITSEVRSKLQDLLDDLIASLDVNELDANQRIKMLQIALQYTLPKLRSTETSEKPDEDLPLFID